MPMGREDTSSLLRLRAGPNPSRELKRKRSVVSTTFVYSITSYVAVELDDDIDPGEEWVLDIVNETNDEHMDSPLPWIGRIEWTYPEYSDYDIEDEGVDIVITKNMKPVEEEESA